MIRELRLNNFRNYAEENILFDEGINVFLGENGHGKTNLLEAVYFLGMLSSFRKADAGQMIKKGEHFFSIEGSFEDDEATNLVVERGHKRWNKISADGWPCSKKLDYIGRIRMVVFSPDEIELIQGSPEGRRRYIDRTFFNIRRSHLASLKTYKRVLSQRNLLLKRGLYKRGELDLWSERLALEGAKVVKGRLEIVGMINAELKKEYPFLGSDSIALNYKPSGGDEYGEDEDIEEVIAKRLSALRKEESFRRVTLAGPHRDDMDILINGEAARSFSSRGEMRSILLALKAVEVEIYRSIWGGNTMILLDDVASELDLHRREALLRYLRQQGEQVLITTTEEDNIPLLDSGKDRIFRVENGEILH